MVKVRCGSILLTSKQDPIMSNNSIQDFAARFAAASTQSLVEEFNRQVGSNAWTSTRAVHDQSLIAEFRKRGIDVTAVYDGALIDFRRNIHLNEATNSLILQ